MSQENQTPAAFLCYTRFDDSHNQGQLTAFRKLLSAEVRAQTGEEFSIFQDRDSIDWGQNWKERITQALNETTFLIPVVTPSFFASSECRNELQIFLARERELNRTDLILPLYYIDVATIEDESKRDCDETAKAISTHQWADWRDLRFEPPSSHTVRKRVAELALQIRNALHRARRTSEASGLEISVAEAAEGRKGWHEFTQAMERLTSLSENLFPSLRKHVEKMNENLERYQAGSTPAVKNRNLSLAASQLRSGAKAIEQQLTAVKEIFEDSTGYILGFPSRRDPGSASDRNELSAFCKELTKVANSLKPRLDEAQQLRYKVLKLGDLGQEMDIASQRMAKAFMALLALFKKFQDVTETTIKDIDSVLNS